MQDPISIVQSFAIIISDVIYLVHETKTSNPTVDVAFSPTFRKRRKTSSFPPKKAGKNPDINRSFPNERWICGTEKKCKWNSRNESDRDYHYFSTPSTWTEKRAHKRLMADFLPGFFHHLRVNNLPAPGLVIFADNLFATSTRWLFK